MLGVLILETTSKLTCAPDIDKDLGLHFVKTEFGLSQCLYAGEA